MAADTNHISELWYKWWKMRSVQPTTDCLCKWVQYSTGKNPDGRFLRAGVSGVNLFSGFRALKAVASKISGSTMKTGLVPWWAISAVLWQGNRAAAVPAWLETTSRNRTVLLDGSRKMATLLGSLSDFVFNQSEGPHRVKNTYVNKKAEHKLHMIRLLVSQNSAATENLLWLMIWSFCVGVRICFVIHH